jgi:hypothetical protein
MGKGVREERGNGKGKKGVREKGGEVNRLLLAPQGAK